jgi:hypothetical protein
MSRVRPVQLGCRFALRLRLRAAAEPVRKRHVRPRIAPETVRFRQTACGYNCAPPDPSAALKRDLARFERARWLCCAWGALAAAMGGMPATRGTGGGLDSRWQYAPGGRGWRTGAGFHAGHARHRFASQRFSSHVCLHRLSALAGCSELASANLAVNRHCQSAEREPRPTSYAGDAPVARMQKRTATDRFDARSAWLAVREDGEWSERVRGKRPIMMQHVPLDVCGGPADGRVRRSERARPERSGMSSGILHRRRRGSAGAHRDSLSAHDACRLRWRAPRWYRS